ncbi:septum formation initiator family protein [Muricauda sp. SCSIO 64092]|uniref:FtsB family cell division protein n=1 Tax=Allomuricauda sp. SCSIO 64092 TaxID=2908842 RepID=UPI001FF5D7FF|nr:septum formation initiator family protein [Muricauda sp. SCSIO 64092]UOY07280.1 septum formation initiator family protein [Muricauda sp. SCSIO 64092]
MGWKELRQKKWFKVFTNTYILVLTIFAIWMAFFDTNSLLIHRELQQEINKLEQQKDFLQKEIEKDKKLLNELKDPKALEKYAREHYYMKKDNEEVFLIEYEDSTKVGN